MRYVFKIDKDNKLPFDKFKKDWLNLVRDILEKEKLKLVDVVVKESPSKRGYHIWVHAEGKRKLKNMDFVRIQYLLGDDETRAYLAIKRIERGIRHWNKMFSKIVWKRDERYQIDKCLSLLNKKSLSREEKTYIAEYLQELFTSLQELKEKIKSLQT